MPPRIAQVVVGLPVHGPFDYAIPEDIRDSLRIGSRVLVSFGQSRRVGYCVGFLKKSSFDRLKPILKLLDRFPVLDQDFLDFAKVFSRHYGCSWGEAIEIALPTALRSSKESTIEVPSREVRKGARASASLIVGELSRSGAVLAERIRAVLSDGESVLFLVPELNQIPAVRDFLSKLDSGTVADLERAGSPKRECEQWLSVREGRARIAVGTRSAVLALMPRLGLIVIADEENPTYKNEPSPFYHVRDVAFLRQKFENCELLFVSPSPSVELWLKIKTRDRMILPQKNTASVGVIDLTNFKFPNQLISFPLQNALLETISKGGKALLLLNRRGFSLMTKCRHCGYVLRCERCAKTLSYRHNKSRLVCSSCGNESELPSVCPSCQGAYLRSTGTGIEKLRGDLARVYPQARVALFDKGSKVFEGEADILVATSAVLPYLRREAFSLIAMIDFDGEINRPDFRAAARVFAVLTRLKLAAGEKLMIQTRDARHPVIASVRSGDVHSFYKEEGKIRRAIGLPPFSVLVALFLRSSRESRAAQSAQALYEDLVKIEKKSFEPEVPQPDLTPKLRDQFRFVIMLKGNNSDVIMREIGPVLGSFRSRDVILTVDVNP